MIIINKSLDSFENFKKLLENNSNNDKTEEKAENKEEIQLENKINNVVLTIFQRYNKYNILLQQKSKFANSLKEYYLIEKFRNEITKDKAIIGKLEIQINEMKSIIKYLLPANIANIKRKILDIVNYSIFKQNKDSFKMDENYCPNKSFLDKIYDKLINFSKKDNLPEDQKTKVKDRIVFIDAQKNKKNSSTTFPYKCVNDDLDDILKFFYFYKKELNNIVHISKDAMKYYLLPFNKEINTKFTELFNTLNNEIKNKKENNNFNREENEESDSSYKWPIKIDINIDDAIYILLNDKFGKEVKRNEILTKYSEKKKYGYKPLLKKLMMI